MTIDHDEMEELLAAFVLGACDERDGRRVRAHLSTCEGCRAVLRRLSQVVEALSLAAEAELPPDGLRDRIVDAAAVASPDVAGDPPRIVAPHPPGAGPRSSRARSWRLPVPLVAAAMVATALVAIIAWNVSLHHQPGAPPAGYPMVGTGTMASASGTVTPGPDVAVVTLRGLPPPPAGKVYELWLTDSSGRQIPDGVFTPTASGTATLSIDRPLSGIRSVAVTPETAPHGAQRPTTAKPELAGQLGG